MMTHGLTNPRFLKVYVQLVTARSVDTKAFTHTRTSRRRQEKTLSVAVVRGHRSATEGVPLVQNRTLITQLATWCN